MNEDGDRKIKTPNRGLVICGVDASVDILVDADVMLSVQHVQLEHEWKEDRTRQLNEAGENDSIKMLNFSRNKVVFSCSPY